MIEKFTYVPKGVCSTKMSFEVEDDVILSVDITGGCNGNLTGISRLLKGKSVNEVIEAFSGLNCGPRPTSCPDQIATALKKQFQK